MDENIETQGGAENLPNVEFSSSGNEVIITSTNESKAVYLLHKISEELYGTSVLWHNMTPNNCWPTRKPDSIYANSLDLTFNPFKIYVYFSEEPNEFKFRVTTGNAYDEKASIEKLKNTINRFVAPQSREGEGVSENIKKFMVALKELQNKYQISDSMLEEIVNREIQ